MYPNTLTLFKIVTAKKISNCIDVQSELIGYSMHTTSR